MIVKEILDELGHKHQIKMEQFINQYRIGVSKSDGKEKYEYVMFPADHLDEDHIIDFIRYAKKKLQRDENKSLLAKIKNGK